MKTAFPFAEIPNTGELGKAYVTGSAQVIPWFDYDPHDQGSLAARIAELDERARLDVLGTANRGAWAATAHAQQQRWNAGAEALTAAHQLGHPATYAVATGQQVGLFGGPLYAVLKAVSAILWARKLKAQFPDHQFVPVFWMGTSDSDFDEVRHTWVLDQSGELHELALSSRPPAEEGLLVGLSDVRAEVSGLLAQLDATLAQGTWRDEVLNGLRHAYRDGGLAEGFARWMALLFSGTELVLIDPQDPVLMQAAKPLIRRELETAAATEALAAERSAEIATAGFTPQLEQIEGDTGLFLIDGAGRREKIARVGDGFKLRQSGQALSLAELTTVCDVTPERFVAGVNLRPIYQNMLFPAVVFIGGFAEIAYRAQIIPLFHHHNQKMAPAYPRNSATLLPAKLAAQMDEMGLGLLDCYVPPQDLAARAVDQRLPNDLSVELANYRRAIEDADGRLLAAATELDPALQKAFETLRGNLLRHLDKLEKKITNTLKRHNETLVQRAARFHSLVYPRLALQERMLPLLSFLPRAGFGLVAQLVEQLEVPDWTHRVVILE